MDRANAGGPVPAYKVEGQGQPLVLIMGVGGTKEVWFFQVRAFRPYYRVITFDNRGVGRSEGQPQPFTIETMVNDTVALLDHLAIDQAHILGYSLGGVVAQEIAIRYPQRVTRLVLASTLALGPEADGSAPGARGALNLEPGAGRQSAADLNPRRLMPSLIELSFNRWPYRLVLGLLGRLYAGRVKPEGLASQVQAAAGANTVDRLGSIRADTLVLTGTGDRLINPSASNILASRIPHARLVTIEGGSHAVFVERSGRFNRAVLDFLRES